MVKRMRIFRSGLSIGLIFLCLCFLCGPSIAAREADQYEYIDISNPFLRKIPLAIPNFKIDTTSPKDKIAAREASELLADSLGFTGYFKLLDQGAFLFDPEKDGVLTTEINFQNWTVIGAELLITGFYQTDSNGNIKLELRLFDTFKNKRILGKRYSGSPADRRDIILRFCSEVINYLTGHPGFFQSKIAFLSTTSGTKEIYTCDFDGSNPKRETRNKAITLFPAWSSDGKWMAYTSYKAGKPDLFIKNLKDNTETIVAREGINITPAWVPGKLELAATLSFSGDQEIYLLTGSGKIIKRLTRNRGIDVTPTWSPDGKQIAFVSNRSGTAQIYIKNLSSDRVRRLTFEGNKNTQPTWSPKGDKIAYTSQINGQHNIFVVGLDGLDPIQLTSDSGDNESPSWSPDGSMIAFSSTREGPSRIFVMTAFGTDQRRLFALEGEQTNPKWSMNFSNN